MSHPRRQSNMADISSFLERHTAKKKNKEKETLYNKFEVELERMADHFTQTHIQNNNLKRDKTLSKNITPQPKHQSNNQEFPLPKKENRNKDVDNSDVEDKRTSSLQYRDQYNSLHSDKRNLSTFRTEKEKRNERNQKEKLQHRKQEINSFGLLLEQNEKLAVKVGELETRCQVLIQNQKIGKSRYKQEVKNAESRYYNEMKQRVYMQKLSYFYKTKALEYLELLRENGIRVDDPITEESMVGDSSRF